jgi:hypothetical protein
MLWIEIFYFDLYHSKVFVPINLTFIINDYFYFIYYNYKKYLKIGIKNKKLIKTYNCL